MSIASLVVSIHRVPDNLAALFIFDGDAIVAGPSLATVALGLGPERRGGLWPVRPAIPAPRSMAGNVCVGLGLCSSDTKKASSVNGENMEFATSNLDDAGK